jgi:hypothetical protein
MIGPALSDLQRSWSLEMEFELVSTLNLVTLLAVLGLAVRELQIVRRRRAEAEA